MPQVKNPSLHKKVSTFFHDYGVILRMGERVVDVNETFGLYTITTTSEINNKLEADRVYFCTGFIPNTEFMKNNFPQSLDIKNHIKVDEYLRLEGTTNIWAIGDCNNTLEIKTVYIAVIQAAYLIKNLRKLVHNKKVPAYEFAPLPPPVLILTLGPLRGVFTAGSKVLSTGTMAVGAKQQLQTLILTKLGQEKSLMKIDYDKILTKDLKSLTHNKEIEEDEEEGKVTLKNLEAEYGFQ